MLSDGRLVGTVSRANLLHGLANTIIDHHEPGAAMDRQLRHELMKILLDEHKLYPVFVNGRRGRSRGENPAMREVSRKQSWPRPMSGVPV